MGNIWCQSSCTEDGCKLSRSQKCPAAVKKGMLGEINRTAAYKAYERLLLLWPQGGKSSAGGNTQSHLQHCSTNQPAGRAGARSRADYATHLGSLYIFQGCCYKEINLLLATLEKEAVGLFSENQFQVNVSEIHTNSSPEMLDYTLEPPLLNILKDGKNKRCCEEHLSY